MDRTISMLLIGLVFGGGIGFLVAASQGVTLDGHDHGSHGAKGGHDMTATAGIAHDHSVPLRLPPGPDAPAVTAVLNADPMAGWNLHVTTTGAFRFAPEHASGAAIPGEGHAHVYVNGNKIARLYGNWMHIDALPDGAAVSVTLNANDHRPLAIGDTPVAAIATRRSAAAAGSDQP